MPEAVVITFLGVVIIITGLFHVWGEFRIGGVFTATHQVLHTIMGVFEIILGVMLVISPLGQSEATYWVVTIWSLVFGDLVIGEAIIQWLASREAAKKAAANETNAPSTTTS